MIAYGDQKIISNVPRKCYEYEVLNELKDLSSRCDANCLKHTRFLFECDHTDLDVQMDRAMSLRADEMAVRATFSGSKSVHVIIEFSSELEDICRDYYKGIWAACNQLFFNGEADKACANPARLTRRPNAIREGGAVQKLLYDFPENVIEKSSYAWRCIWRVARAHIAKKSIVNMTTSNFASNSGKKNDNLCASFDKVKYYLNKSFPKLKGNGDSSISLFKAIRCCMQYNDGTTLDKVIAKAKSERWTDKEIDHILKNIDRYIS